MKIAVLRQRVTGFGGAEATLGYLVRGLAARGQAITVYATEPPEEGAKVLGPGIGYVRVPVWGGKAGRLLTYALNTRRLLTKGPHQVILSLERTLLPQVYRAGDGCHREWLARRAPFLSLPGRLAQGLSPFHRTLLALEGRLFRSPELRRIIANSSQVRQEIKGHYGVDPSRLRVIHNGLNREKFRPLDPGGREALRASLGGSAQGRVILFVGSGFRRKGLTYLIEAFGRLKDRDAVLWVVGKGSPAPYRRQAARLGVAPRVIFWGPRAEVAPFYQAAAVLALPTIYDPCSNVVLEALGCGTPVVTTTGNGAREFLTPGQNGEILSGPDDLSGLAAALDAFLGQDRDPRVRQAAVQAVAGLSWETTVSQTLTVLEEAAGDSRGLFY
jgi:UDP-glucose:(heptosyl)LPS alpha-1,3-glucosyltransferase